MIYGTLDRIEAYSGLEPRTARALRFLAETDLAKLAPGRYELEGEDLYLSVQSYDSRTENPTPEAHRRYIDIQCMIEGEELVGVAPLDSMESLDREDPENDVWFYRGKADYLLLKERRFVIFWPEDAHAPSISPNGIPAPCKKCVAKIKVEQ